jgi:hypothetical protein
MIYQFGFSSGKTSKSSWEDGNSTFIAHHDEEVVKQSSKLFSGLGFIRKSMRLPLRFAPR